MMARNAIALPQVSSGVVQRVLEAVWTEMPGEPITREWLEERRFSQAPQILDLLSFLGLVEAASGRIVENVRASRGDAKAFYQLLRGMVVQAYANAGLGAVETLGWLGRDRLRDRQLRAAIEDKGPFRQLDAGTGGAKNARSCLKGLHGFLLDWKGRHGRKRAAAVSGGPATAARRRSGTRAGAADVQAEDIEAGRGSRSEVVQKRFSDLEAARQFVRLLPAGAEARDEVEDKRIIRVPFCDRQGAWRTAVVSFQSEPDAGQLVALGRMLQAMGEQMGR